MNARAMRLWCAVLAVLVGAALASTFHTVRTAPALRQQILRRQADLARLADLAGKHARDEANVAAVAAAGAGAAPLGEWIKATWPAWRADVRQRESVPLIEGWSVQLMDVMLEDVYMTEAGRFLGALETGRPPWRVVEIHLTATEGRPGHGRMSLLAEGLQRTATSR